MLENASSLAANIEGVCRDMGFKSLVPELDSGGVWPLLLIVSGHAAKERGADFIDAIDLLKAIYIVDLEHVAKFWSTWEQFETLVSNQALSNGLSRTYINRTVYLTNLHAAMRGHDPSASHMLMFPGPSTKVQEIVNVARELATKREGSVSTFGSRDLLFGICACDYDMRLALHESGLLIEELKKALGQP